jgi:hypothetical protein
VNEGRATARDEASMRAKWISQALRLHRERLERLEEKSNVATSKRAAAEELRQTRYNEENEEGSDEGENGDNESEDEEEETDQTNEVPKKFGGGFSMEQCMAAVRVKAREREEAANSRFPEAAINQIASDDTAGKSRSVFDASYLSYLYLLYIYSSSPITN